MKSETIVRYFGFIFLLFNCVFSQNSTSSTISSSTTSTPGTGTSGGGGDGSLNLGLVIGIGVSALFMVILVGVLVLISMRASRIEKKKRMGRKSRHKDFDGSASDTKSRNKLEDETGASTPKDRESRSKRHRHRNASEDPKYGDDSKSTKSNRSGKKTAPASELPPLKNIQKTPKQERKAPPTIQTGIVVEDDTATPGSLALLPEPNVVEVAPRNAPKTIQDATIVKVSDGHGVQIEKVSNYLSTGGSVQSRENLRSSGTASLESTQKRAQIISSLAENASKSQLNSQYNNESSGSQTTFNDSETPVPPPRRKGKQDSQETTAYPISPQLSRNNMSGKNTNAPGTVIDFASDTIIDTTQPYHRPSYDTVQEALAISGNSTVIPMPLVPLPEVVVDPREAVKTKKRQKVPTIQEAELMESRQH